MIMEMVVGIVIGTGVEIVVGIGMGVGKRTVIEMIIGHFE
jgi:hypothetical protein